MSGLSGLWPWSFEAAPLRHCLTQQLTPFISDKRWTSNQKQITLNHRFATVNWLCSVQKAWKLGHSTYVMAVHILDSFLHTPEAKDMSLQKLQLVGIVSLFLAAKMNETLHAGIWTEDCKEICDNCYTRSQIIKMESTILKALQFRMPRPAGDILRVVLMELVPEEYVKRTAWGAMCSREYHATMGEQYKLAEALHRIALCADQAWGGGCHSYTRVAAACAWVAARVWTPRAEALTGLTEDHLSKLKTYLQGLTTLYFSWEKEHCAFALKDRDLKEQIDVALKEPFISVKSPVSQQETLPFVSPPDVEKGGGGGVVAQKRKAESMELSVDEIFVAVHVFKGLKKPWSSRAWRMWRRRLREVKVLILAASMDSERYEELLRRSAPHVDHVILLQPQPNRRRVAPYCKNVTELSQSTLRIGGVVFYGTCGNQIASDHAWLRKQWESIDPGDGLQHILLMYLSPNLLPESLPPNASVACMLNCSHPLVTSFSGLKKANATQPVPWPAPRPLLVPFTPKAEEEMAREMEKLKI